MNEFLHIPLDQILIDRDARQRREIDVSDLLSSVAARGVLVPVIVTQDGELFRLIAGERRYTAAKQLNHPTIPARLFENLPPLEAQIIELEENIKRHNLSWQDEARAIREIHKIYLSQDPSWSQSRTAENLGLSQGHISHCINVANELDAGNKFVAQAQGIRAAINVVSRRDNRLIADAMNDLLDSPKPIEQEESILHANFHEFAKNYSGPLFNLIHCDFPYGINHDKSDQGGSTTVYQSYSDSEETYWNLCHTLATYRNKLIAQSAHIVFWLSSDIRRQFETIEFFKTHAPDLDFQTVPIIWLKSDNRGILPDPTRQPRRIFETALIASCGDREILRAVSNAYACPTSKEIHQSEKPEPMLRHFFQMFVDSNTRLLDPTSGSGSSLRAAESLGAQYVLGLEIQEEFVQASRSALRRARNLRNV